MADELSGKCQCGDCDETFSETDWMYLNPNCHYAPAQVRVKGNVLEVLCIECEKVT